MVRKLQTVLVIEDDEEWSELFCKALEPTYRTRTASNGTDGFEMARRSRPDLIILDVMMPGGMDGFSTLCELRKDAVTKDVPVLMCSAVNATANTAFTEAELERYLGVAPSVFIEKPVSPKRLLAEVKSLLG